MKVHFVKAARKEFTAGDGKLVKKGSSYYWWKFRYGSKRTKTTPPIARELTQNAFQLFLYDVSDVMNNLASDEGLVDQVQEIIDMINDRVSELQSSLDSMPEQLQDSSEAGQVLQERIDGLESWASDIENVDLEVDVDSIRGEIAEELEIEDVEKIPKDKKNEFEIRVQDRITETYDEKVEEIKATDPGL